MRIICYRAEYSYVFQQGFSMAESAEQAVAKINADLKGRKVGITVELVGNRLYLRGTLPPRPNDTKTKPYFQRIALGIYANPTGIKAAKAQAEKLSSDLILNRFKWSDWIGDKPQPKSKTVGDWLEDFEKSYFTERKRDGQSENTWRTNYRSVFRKLDPDKKLTPEILLEAIGTTEPDTKIRLAACQAYKKLAEFAGFELDTKRLKGRYTPKTVQPRDLPTDDLIVSTRSLFTDPSWQFIYGLLATYGLRNHEAFLLDFDSLDRDTGAITVTDGKTGSRRVYPYPASWYLEWQLWEKNLPQTNRKKHCSLGEAVSLAFRKFGCPFTPYTLRHCWAIRVAVMGLDPSIAAKLQGHSVEQHTETYMAWINDSHYSEIWRKLNQLPE